MRAFVVVGLLLTSLLLTRVMSDDLANIGPFMYPSPDNRDHFQRDAVTSSDWNHELDGLFPGHGAVNLFFFRNPTTKRVSNCLRIIGGKVSSVSDKYESDVLGTDRGSRRLTRTEHLRFADQYLCFSGVDAYGFAPFATIPMQVFINGLHAMQTDTLVHSGNPTDDVNQVGFPSVNSYNLANRASNTWTKQPLPFIEMMWPRVVDQRGVTKGGFCLDASQQGAFGAFCLEGFTGTAVEASSSTYLLCESTIHRDSDGTVAGLFGTDLSGAQYTLAMTCLNENSAPSGNVGNAADCGIGMTLQECIWRAGAAYIHFPVICAALQTGNVVHCLDGSKHLELASNSSNRNTFVDSVTNVFALQYLSSDFTTADSLNYYSWESDHLDRLFDGLRRFPAAIQTAAGKGYLPDPSPSNRQIFSLPWAHAIKNAQGILVYDVSSAETTDAWKAYADSIFRVPTNHFFMDCPLPTRDTDGVAMQSPCNSQVSNLNVCEQRTGRCVCDPQWLGIACDIQHPVNGDGELVDIEDLVGDPTDPYEICSTAGALLERATFTYPTSATATVTKTIPICTCIAGFEGLPTDFKSFVPLYASLLHTSMASRYATRYAVSLDKINTQQWFSTLSTAEFDEAHNLHDAITTPPSGLSSDRPLGLKFNWFDYVMKHQCLLWTRRRDRPPQNVWFDYQFMPFLAAGNTGSLASYSYETDQGIWYPWPAISTSRRNATAESRNNTAADGRRGIRCMDYREFDWDRLSQLSNADQPSFFVAKFVQWMENNPTFWSTSVDTDGSAVIPKARLYGGRLCTPCPDCNRSNSVCVEGDPVSYICDCNPSTETCETSSTHYEQCTPITPGSCRTCNPVCPADCPVILSGYFEKTCNKAITTYHKTCTTPGPNVCKCDENFCGPTCDVPMCPVAASGKICGNGTCTINPATNCENLQPGQYGGVCKCEPGYTGIDCSTPTCPFFSSIDGTQCGNGTCNDEAGKCECNVGWTGNACDTPACPFDPNTNLECAGAVRADNGESVCNRVTQKCECFRTIALNLGPSFVSGWINTDLTAFVNGRYGVACEKVFGRACRDPQDGTWCGQPIQANGNFDGARVAGYAGCYNETCVTKQLGGEECTPYCHCTLEFAVAQNTYCRKSVCGPEYCGFPKGKCNPSCSKNGAPQAETTCTTTAVLAGNLTLTPTCDCQVFNGTFYYHKHDDPDATAPCVDPAPACYTPATVHSPCNGHGDCAYNVTSDSHFCKCDAGYSGANCSVAPSCFTPVTGAACIGPTRSCSHDLGHNNAAVCACNSSYFRDPDRNCTLERCVSTGGLIDSDGECTCPNNTALYSDPPLSRTDLNHVALGCRKRCPVSIFDGIECGAYMYPSNTVSRCSDLYPTKDPIFGDDARPAPQCICDFLGLDHKGQLNYFINASDFATSGMCEPKCNPDGVCKGDDCLPSGSPVGTSFPFECHCSPNHQGDRCEQIKCDPTHSHHTGDGQCHCDNWCKVGTSCDVDLCAPSGGKCQAGLPDCDCSSTSNVLRLDSSNGRISNRNCTSACLNGGTLSSDKQRCNCIEPYYGVLCEKQRGCNPQWRGVSCNISNCFNGATPKSNVNDTGCVCADAFYAGILCDQDLCIVANRRNRTSTSTCVCAWSFSGDSCQVDPCSPGGSLSLLTGQCQCNLGWILASNLTACLLPSADAFYCDPDHGTVFNRSDGTQACICDSDYIGVNCSVPRCTAPLQGPYCTCPAGSYSPPVCDEDYCNSAAVGYNITTQRCICPTGYVLSNDVDASGTLQCVPDPHYCNYLGTADWNNVSNHIPCICEDGWSGPTCSSFTSATDDTSDDPVLSKNAMIAIAAATFLVIVLGISGWIIYVKCIRDPLPTLLTQPTVNVTASKHWRNVETKSPSSNQSQWTRLRNNSDEEDNE